MVESLYGRDQSVAPDNTLTTELLNTPWVDDLASKIRTHSFWTFDHSQRVAQVAEGLGRNLGLNQEDRLSLARAGLLHDVGKIKVPNEILNRTDGELTAGERKILDKHPKTGFEMVWSEDRNVSVLIVSHHEFQDRKYPRTAERPSLDEKTRILQSYVALADEVDAMLSERPYKRVLSENEAKATLNRIFNPADVDIALRIRQTLPNPLLYKV